MASSSFVRLLKLVWLCGSVLAWSEVHATMLWTFNVTWNKYYSSILRIRNQVMCAHKASYWIWIFSKWQTFLHFANKHRYKGNSHMHLWMLWAPRYVVGVTWYQILVHIYFFSLVKVADFIIRHFFVLRTSQPIKSSNELQTLKFCLVYM